MINNIREEKKKKLAKVFEGILNKERILMTNPFSLAKEFKDIRSAPHMSRADKKRIKMQRVDINTKRNVAMKFV